MKVTAIIPDEIVNDIKQYTNGNTLTDCLIIALEEWISLTKIKQLNKSIEKSPLKFNKEYSASQIRKINRRR